jgi:hypothetical protein
LGILSPYLDFSILQMHLKQNWMNEFSNRSLLFNRTLLK